MFSHIVVTSDLPGHQGIQMVGPERRAEPQQKICVLREVGAEFLQLPKLRHVLVDETTHMLLGI